MAPAGTSISLASAPVPAPVLDVEPAEPAPKKKRLSRLDKWREARVRAAAGGGGDNDSDEPQAAVTGRRVLIGREALVYLAEQGQLDVWMPSTFWGFESAGHRHRMPDGEHGHISGGNAYLAFIARLYYGIEATSCQAKRNISALAHLMGDLRSRMLASKVERMMFIPLNRHLIDEVRDMDVAVAQARARVAKSTQISVAPQEERSNMRLLIFIQDET